MSHDSQRGGMSYVSMLRIRSRCVASCIRKPADFEPARGGSSIQNTSRTKRSRLALAIIAIAIAGSGFLVSAYTFHFLGLFAKDCAAHPTNAPNTAYFTILMTQQGYNGSQSHAQPWPIMNVTINETVTIHVMNKDPTQSHGFAVTHYFSNGLALQPGDCIDVNFTANQLGTFRVFCTIFCTVHFFMQDGEFNVNP